MRSRPLASAWTGCLLLLVSADASALQEGGPSLELDDSQTAAIDSIFSRWDNTSGAGCAVGVGTIGIGSGPLSVFERAYGMANLEYAIANTPSTVFEGGSVSKQFTAAAIVLLALEGELSLDDDVRDHVPELPDYGETVTIRHLLTHTSGLRDWGSVAAISGWGRERRSHDHDWALDIMSRQTALNFSPGTQYSYSNSGYNLAAVIVARVSGRSFADFSRERIFEPLGLGSTQWRDDYRRPVPGRSTGYRPAVGGWLINHPIEHVHGNGGILTTVGDLIAWTHALATGEGLGGAPFVEAMHERGILRDGSRIPYASGIVHGELGGAASVTHTGSTAGYRAFLGRYPDHDLTVAMLCNAANAPTGGTGNAVARVVLGGTAANAQRATAIDMSQESLAEYSGLYRNPNTGTPKRLRVSAGVLREGPVELVPVAEGRFSVGGGARHYVFMPADSGRPTLVVDSWEYTDERFEPVDEWLPSAEELAGFAGVHESDEAETVFTFSVEDGRLVLTRRPGNVTALNPVYEDAFQMPGGTLRFRRDADGEVSGLRLSVSRVFDMRFEKR